MSDPSIQVAYRRLWAHSKNWESADVARWLPANDILPSHNDYADGEDQKPQAQTNLSVVISETHPTLSNQVALEAGQLLSMIPVPEHDPLGVWNLSPELALKLLIQTPMLVVKTDTGFQPVGDLELAHSILRRQVPHQKVMATVVDPGLALFNSLSVLLHQPVNHELRASQVIDTASAASLQVNSDALLAAYDGISESAVRHRRRPKKKPRELG